MKKSTLTLLVLLVSVFAWSQIVTTTPTIITDDYTGTIEVVFDATKGTAGLKDFTGNVYAHTGVFTETSPSTWAHAPVWGGGSRPSS